MLDTLRSMCYEIPPVSRAPIDVLVVEDSPEISLLIQDVMARQGVRCSLAADLKSAQELMRGHPYDFVILDLLLPDGSGLDLLSCLKTGESINLPQIIISSGNVSKDPYGNPQIKRIYEKPYRVQDLVFFLKSETA